MGGTRQALLAVGSLALISISARAATPPFLGVVTREGDAAARAGPGQAYYQVERLQQGKVVRVRAEEYGWYAIQPPADSFSYLAKSAVERVDDTTGRVTADRAKVLAPAASPGQSYHDQARLSAGTTVEIVGVAGKHYKIAPPEGARLYLQVDHVAPATEQTLSKAGLSDQRIRAVLKKAAISEEDSPSTDSEGSKKASEKKEVAEKRGSEKKKGAEKPADKKAGADGGASDEAAQAVKKPSPEEAGGSEAAADQGSAEKGAEEQDQPLREDGAVVVRILSDGGVRMGEGSYLPRELRSALKKIAQKQSGPLHVKIKSPLNVSIDRVQQVKKAVEEAGTKEVSFASAAPQSLTENLTLGNLRRRFEQVSQLPLADQPLSLLKKELEKLMGLAALSDRDLAIAKSLHRTVQNRIAAKKAIEDIDKLEKKMEARARRRAKGPKSYDAVGGLRVSTLYDGESLPRLYRLVERGGERTKVYIKPKEGQALSSLLGEIVGVAGEVRFDESLGIEILELERIDRLQASPTPESRGATGSSSGDASPEGVATKK